jgi:hypothetical protein
MKQSVTDYSQKEKNPRTLSADPECREILDIFYDVQSSQSEVRGAKMHQNHGLER